MTTACECVAAACGLTIADFDGVDMTIVEDCGCCHKLNFNPASYAEDAVYCAEKYGLMYQNCELRGLTLPDGVHGWAVWHHAPGARGVMIGSGTFCEAICQAILHLEERRKRATRQSP